MNANRMKRLLNNIRRFFEITYFCWSNRKLPGWQKFRAQIAAWSSELEGHAQKRVERYCGVANKKQEELESVGQLSEVCK